MPRLTRAESQARTRDRLVDTAMRLFLDDGYAATSLERVADAAGFSKGAVYSNFRGKDELCLAVLDLIHEQQVQRVAVALASADTIEDRLVAFERWAEANIGDPRWTGLEVEFSTSIRHSARIRKELADRDRAIRDLISGIIAGVAEEFGLVLPMSADDIATMLLSLGIGLGVQRAIDPTIGVGVLTDTIRTLLAVSRP